MTLTRRLRCLIDTQRLLRQQSALLQARKELIEALAAQREHELRRTNLLFLYEMRAIAGGWLLSMEQPEVDIREDVVQMDATFADQIARLEEHVV
jgi:hypothetical protein